ncbi:hypothetical protein DEO72_LG8g1620 [Vigna unguiculata]|uniref:Uncharacterized protein n=1 Tax=Vigna unguiculata TaxID=3917 RepID=A0A4D6MUK7_VIGUN|nr:hypothetical protein DEO72_LG8g1620 [Vigna unguiculata]
MRDGTVCLPEIESSNDNDPSSITLVTSLVEVVARPPLSKATVHPPPIKGSDVSFTVKCSAMLPPPSKPTAPPHRRTKAMTPL